MLYIGCALVGLVAGLLSALLGVGGGIIVVPVLVVLFGMDMRAAVGTSLAYIAVVALAGAAQHMWRGNVELKVAAVAIPFGFLGTYLGMRLSAELSTVTLKRLFAILLILMAAQLLFFPQSGSAAKRGEPGAGRPVPGEPPSDTGHSP
jgi:hypothetical protein